MSTKTATNKFQVNDNVYVNDDMRSAMTGGLLTSTYHGWVREIADTRDGERWYWVSEMGSTEAWLVPESALTAEARR